MKKIKARIRSQQEYSYYIKRAQIVVIIIALGMLMFKCCRGYGHVDLHFHSIEWETEQHMREAREVLVEEWHLQNPDASEESSEEVDERIRQGFEYPC